MNLINVCGVLSLLMAAIRLASGPWAEGSIWMVNTILWTLTALVIHNSKRGGKQ